MKRIDLKPLSTNKAWRGRHFDTPEKKRYAIALKKQLEGCILADCIAPYEIHWNLYIPKAMDYDNAIKCTQDLICSHFWIDDKDIYKAIITKYPTKKDHYFEVDILTYNFN